MCYGYCRRNGQASHQQQMERLVALLESSTRDRTADEANNCERVKLVILKWYDINEKVLSSAFSQCQEGSWAIFPAEMDPGIRAVAKREDDLRVWIRERRPCSDAGELADQYAQARKLMLDGGHWEGPRKGPRERDHTTPRISQVDWGVSRVRKPEIAAKGGNENLNMEQSPIQTRRVGSASTADVFCMVLWLLKIFLHHLSNLTQLFPHGYHVRNHTLVRIHVYMSPWSCPTTHKLLFRNINWIITWKLVGNPALLLNNFHSLTHHWR